MEKRNKKQVIIAVTVLLLVTLTLLGITYAYYRTRIIGNENDKSISVTSKKMEVTYKDGSAVLSTEGNIEPGFTASKTFYVKNTGNQDVVYSVVLDEMTNEFIRNQDWQILLTKNGTEVIGANDKLNLAVGTHQVLLGSEILSAPTNGNESIDTYVLTLTYLNQEEIDQSEDMGMELTLRVNIGEETYTWEDAPSNSLLYALRTNQPSGSEETTPGEASTANEARILTTEDDYGISYVYRGNVENNYVTYSGMCWRVVRVQGDGSIKLALADTNHPCGTANGYNPDDTDSAFVDDEDDNPIIDIMYKANVAGDATDVLFETSDIPGILSTWANTNNLDMSKLVETDWCNDTSISSFPSIRQEQYVHYGTMERWGENLSLKCNFKGLNNTKATRYKNALGLLSFDELMFAGLETSFYNNNVYLDKNAEEYSSWTLSPSFCLREFTECNVNIYNGGAPDSTYINEPEFDMAVQPVVVLKPNVTIVSGGNGQMDTPYVIE